MMAKQSLFTNSGTCDPFNDHADTVTSPMEVPLVLSARDSIVGFFIN